MLRVYLDQNKWIDLARAATGHPSGARFEDALAVARVAARSGAASFPLDMYRYWETSKRADDRSRHDVAEVMRELSAGHTMATPIELLDHEIDVALQMRFGAPEQARSCQVFGLGLRHIGGERLEWPTVDLDALPGGGAVLPGGLRSQLDDAMTEIIERELLRAGPATLRDVGFDQANLDQGRRFVEWENTVADKIREQGLTGLALELAVRASDLSDIRPAVVAALERIGKTWEDFLDELGPKGVFAFMDDLPTRHVTNVMRAAKHRETQQRWQPNDFIDIVALPVAAVYCDVVVTEKQWVHRMSRGDVPQRHGTLLLTDVADLAKELVRASAS